MVRWALKHEQDEGFDPAKVLTSWAKKRRRGAWSKKLRKASAVELLRTAQQPRRFGHQLGGGDLLPTGYLLLLYG